VIPVTRENYAVDDAVVIDLAINNGKHKPTRASPVRRATAVDIEPRQRRSKTQERKSSESIREDQRVPENNGVVDVEMVIDTNAYTMEADTVYSSGSDRSVFLRALVAVDEVMHALEITVPRVSRRVRAGLLREDPRSWQRLRSLRKL